MILNLSSEGRVLNLPIVSDSERYLNVFYLRAKRALFLKCFKRQAAAWGRSVLADRAQRRLARFSNGSILDLGDFGSENFLSPPSYIFSLLGSGSGSGKESKAYTRARGRGRVDRGHAQKSFWSLQKFRVPDSRINFKNDFKAVNELNLKIHRLINQTRY